MNIPRQEKFVCNGKLFEVNISRKNDHVFVHATRDGEKVSPEYSVSLETHRDYSIQYKDDLVQQLIHIVKSGIENGMYFKS